MTAEEDREQHKSDAADVVSWLGVGVSVLAVLWQIIDYLLLGNAQVVIDAFDEVILTSDSSGSLVWTGFALSVCIWAWAALLCYVAGSAHRDKGPTVGATVLIVIALIVVARLLIELVYWVMGMSLVDQSIYSIYSIFGPVLVMGSIGFVWNVLTA